MKPNSLKMAFCTFIILCLLFTSFKICNGQRKREIVLEEYLNKKYKNAKLEKVLRDSSFKQMHRYLYSDKRPGILSGIFIDIDTCYYVEMEFKKVKHEKGFDARNEWDFNKVKKNRVSTYVVVNKCK